MWNQRAASVAREKQHVFESAQRLRNSHGRFASSRSLKHRGERRGVSSMPAVAAVLVPRCLMPWLSSVAAASPWVAADVDTLAASVHRRSRGTPLRKTCGGVQRDNTWVYCEHGSRDACRPPVCPPPPRGGFASSQLGGSGNRTSAFRTSPQVFTTGVVPHYHQPRQAIPSLPLPSADACCEGSLGAGLPSPRERGFPWARLTAAIAIVGEVFSHHVAPACRFTRAHAWRWALRRTFSGMLQASPRYATAHAAG